MTDDPHAETARSMTPDEVDQLQKLRDALKPEASWTRLDTFGKWLVGIVSTVGILGTGFSNAAFQHIDGAGKFVFALAVIFVGLSLGFAVNGLAPQLMSVSLNSVEMMRAEISKQLAQRQKALQASAWFLAMAFITASSAPLFSSFPVRHADPEARVALSYNLKSDGTLQVTLDGSGIAKHTPVELALVARPEIRNLLLPRARGMAGGDGKVQLKVELPGVNKLKSGVFATAGWRAPTKGGAQANTGERQEIEILPQRRQ